MDADLQRTSEDVPLSTTCSCMGGDWVFDQSAQLASCFLCRRILTPNNESVDEHENIRLCGDCKFLFLEDVVTTTQDSYQRLPLRGRRVRYSSSESVENLFLHQFSHMINLARENQSLISGYENQSFDGDAAVRLFQHSTSRTTPSESRRWRRIISDAESDCLDSLYGESESNVSFSRYRGFHGESDAVSFSAYGGDSDASVDGNSFLDTEMFIQPENRSIFDSYTDIDPMNAGVNQQWNSDDPEEDEDGEWEEADVEDESVESTVVRPQIRNYFSSPAESNVPVSGPWTFQSPEEMSPEVEGMFHWRIREVRQRVIRDIFPNLEESGLQSLIGNPGDYLDARGFEELLEHLAETDNSRRGAPPAAVFYVNSLPRVIVNEEHRKQDGLACAICKDLLPAGTEVIQLPCVHLYHQSCLFPWLSARNSCPLCQYELPTNDREYEEGKQNINSRTEDHTVQQRNVSEDGSSKASDDIESVVAPVFTYAVSNSSRENGRGRWLLFAAAPIVSLVGIVLVLWLGNPLTSRRGSADQHQISIPRSAPSTRRENRSRRWWSLF